nr:TATA-binding protein-associated factor 2N-like [Ipomoea batatas]GME21731.1 TATA-binding protein-associated factor 2N-like [Ipomoea batatas]
MATQITTADISQPSRSRLKRRSEKMNRPGDWNCRSCQHLNFQRRDSCQRCGEPRPGGDRGADYGSFGGMRGGGGSSFGGLTGPDVRPGDWYCAVGHCGAHNFASRSSCFKCGAFKDDSSAAGFDADHVSQSKRESRKTIQSRR